MNLNIKDYVKLALSRTGLRNPFKKVFGPYQPQKSCDSAEKTTGNVPAIKTLLNLIL